jgi:hypothetical protein
VKGAAQEVFGEQLSELPSFLIHNDVFMQSGMELG